jgi:hypothetical protein
MRCEHTGTRSSVVTSLSLLLFSTCTGMEYIVNPSKNLLMEVEYYTINQILQIQKHPVKVEDPEFDPLGVGSRCIVTTSPRSRYKK